jgi:hypothetical protein
MPIVLPGIIGRWVNASNSVFSCVEVGVRMACFLWQILMCSIVIQGVLEDIVYSIDAEL